MIPTYSYSPDPDPVTAFSCLKDHILVWEEEELSALRFVAVSNPTTVKHFVQGTRTKIPASPFSEEGPIDQLLFRDHGFLLFDPFQLQRTHFGVAAAKDCLWQQSRSQMSKSFSLGSERLGVETPASKEAWDGDTTALSEGLGPEVVQ